MKKAILFILIVCISCGFCACSSSLLNANDTTVVTVAVATQALGASKKDLSQAMEHLKTAEEEIASFSAKVSNTWSYSKDNVENYYTEGYKNYQEMITSKEKVDSELKKTTSILQFGGSSDYYQAVKAYYVAVKALYDLVYNYPVGYSFITYGQAKQQLQSDCSKAYAEVELYSGS